MNVNNEPPAYGLWGPTLLALSMFPLWVAMYVRLAHHEEREVAAEFGKGREAYSAVTPRWFPRLGGRVARAKEAAGRH